MKSDSKEISPHGKYNLLRYRGCQAPSCEEEICDRIDERIAGLLNDLKRYEHIITKANGERQEVKWRVKWKKTVAEIDQLNQIRKELVGSKETR